VGHYHTTCNIREPNEASPRAISKFAAEPGFCLFRDGSAWRLYKDPIELLIAKDPDSLKESLSRIEQHMHHGREAAGFLGYEAGYALEPRLHLHLARARGPLSYFGLYPTRNVSTTLRHMTAEFSEFFLVSGMVC
jgi:hypothetical protein